VITGYHFSTGKLPLVSGVVAKEIEEPGPLGCPRATTRARVFRKFSKRFAEYYGRVWQKTPVFGDEETRTTDCWGGRQGAALAWTPGTFFL